MEKINAVITGVGGYVPDYILTNEEISKMVDTTDEWIMGRIGIKERRILHEEGLGTSFMARKAVKQLMQRTKSNPDDIVDNDGVLTADRLSSIYYELNKFYFGNDVIVDDEIRYEWERIPHFYYDFYVYKYATGLSAATVIVNNILSGDESAVNNYIEFLKCGSRISPIESLKIAGVDLTNSSVIEAALGEFEAVIDMYRENM